MIPADEFLSSFLDPKEQKQEQKQGNGKLDESSMIPADEFISGAIGTTEQEPEAEKTEGIISRAAPIAASHLAAGSLGGFGSQGEFLGKGLEVMSKEGLQNTVNDILESQGRKGDFTLDHPGVSHEDLVKYFADQDIDDVLPQVILPTIGSTLDLFHKLTGGEYEPKNPLERYIGTTAAATGAAFSPFGGGKAALPALIGGAGTAQTAAELGLGEGWQFLAGILGGGAGEFGRNLYNKPQRTIARTVSNLMKEDPKAKKIVSLMPEARVSSLVGGVGGKTLQGLEGIISKSPESAALYEKQSRALVERIGSKVETKLAHLLGEVRDIGDIAITFEKAMGESIADMERENNTLTNNLLSASEESQTELPTVHGNLEKYEGKAKTLANNLFAKEEAPAPVKNTLSERLEKIAPRENVSQTTRKVQDALKKAETKSKERYSKLYREADNELKGNKRTPLEEEAAKQLDKELGRVITNISGSRQLEHAPAGFAQAVQEIKDLQRMARSVEKEGGRIAIGDLVNASKRINDIFYSSPEGYSKLVGFAREPIENAIAAWANENAPEFLAKRKEANAAFMEHKKIHGGETVRRARRGEKYEAIASGAGKESVHDLLSSALSEIPEGEKTLGGLKRIAAEKALGEMVRETNPTKIASARDKVVNKIEMMPTLTTGEKGSLIEAIDEMTTTAKKNLASTPDRKSARALLEIEHALEKPNLNPVDRRALTQLHSDIMRDVQGGNKGMHEAVVKRSANKRMIERLTEAKKGYAQDADIVFRKKMKTQEGVREVREMLKGVEGGEKIIQDYAKSRIQEDLMGTIDKETGKISAKKFGDLVEKMTKDPYYKELVGKENVQLYQEVVKSLEETSKILDELVSKEAFFANPSQTAHTLKNMANVGKWITAFYELSHGNVVPMVAIAGAKRVSHMTAKLLTDPRFKKELVKSLQPPKMPKTPTQKARAHRQYLERSGRKVMNLLKVASVATEQSDKRNVRD